MCGAESLLASALAHLNCQAPHIKATLGFYLNELTVAVARPVIYAVRRRPGGGLSYSNDELRASWCHIHRHYAVCPVACAVHTQPKVSGGVNLHICE